MILEIVFDYQKISNMMEYTYVQKMSIVKVLLDIISVDGKIDARETHFFEEIKIRLDLSAVDHFRVREYNTLNCLSVIKEMTVEQKNYYRELMSGIILADGVIEENEQIAYDNICEFCGIPSDSLKAK